MRINSGSIGKSCAFIIYFERSCSPSVIPRHGPCTRDSRIRFPIAAYSFAVSEPSRRFFASAFCRQIFAEYWGMTVFFKGKFKYLVHCVFYFLKFEIHFNVYFLNYTFKNDAWYISYFIYFIFCMPGFTPCLEICLQPRAWRLNIISRYGQQRAAKGSGTNAHCQGLVSLFVKVAIN